MNFYLPTERRVLSDFRWILKKAKDGGSIAEKSKEHTERIIEDLNATIEGLDKNEKRYWICMFGPIEKNKLPEGADGPPREAVIKALEEMGFDIDKPRIEIYTGWDCREKRFEKLLALWNKEQAEELLALWNKEQAEEIEKDWNATQQAIRMVEGWIEEGNESGLFADKGIFLHVPKLNKLLELLK